MTHNQLQPLPLSDSPTAPVPPGKDDLRPKMPEPLPVRLVTVENAHILAGAEQETQLNAFYVGLLGFEKEKNESALVYRADNFRLICVVQEPPVANAPTPVLRYSEEPDWMSKNPALRSTSEPASSVNTRVMKRILGRTDMRALGIEVLVLREAEQKLIDAEIQYERRTGLYPGPQSLVLQDPAGNWIELTGRSEFR